MASTVTELLRRRFGGKKGILPSGYTELTWLTNPSGAWIQSPVLQTTNDLIKIETSIRWNEFKNSAIIGADGGVYFGTNNNGYWTNANTTPSQYQASLGVLYNVVMERTSTTSQTLTIDNSITITTTRNQGNNKYMYIFNALNVKGYQALCSIGRIKIHKNGTLAFDGIPCKNSNDVCGLYDLISAQFYSSMTSTPLTGE